MISRIIGITGSRTDYPFGPVFSFIRSLPRDHTCLVISGGARGVDSFADNACSSYNIPFCRIPYLSSSGRSGGMERNVILIDFVESHYRPNFVDVEIRAFWNRLPSSRGTKHAMDYAYSKSLLSSVLDPEGNEILNEIYPNGR